MSDERIEAEGLAGTRQRVISRPTGGPNGERMIYTEPMDPPRALLQEPSRQISLALRWPDAHVSAVGMEWPSDVRLPVAGDAINLPGVGICIVSGATFGLAKELDGDGTHELWTIEIGATVVKGTKR
jgi:hypothetical protein